MKTEEAAEGGQLFASCGKLTPKYCESIYKSVIQLKYDSEPNYEQYKVKLKDAIRQKGVRANDYYDWEKADAKKTLASMIGWFL